MKTITPTATESTAYYFLKGAWHPVKAPGGYPEKWFCSGSVADVQTLLLAELQPLVAHGLPVLLMTKEQVASTP